MQVAQYTFQSPSTSSVQVGRLDPSSIKEEATKNTSPQQAPIQAKTAGEILTPPPSEDTQVKPSVNEAYLLDTYA